MRMLTLLCLLALGLSACGYKGALYLPKNDEVVEKQQTENSESGPVEKTE